MVIDHMRTLVFGTGQKSYNSVFACPVHSYITIILQLGRNEQLRLILCTMSFRLTLSLFVTIDLGVFIYVYVSLAT